MPRCRRIESPDTGPAESLPLDEGLARFQASAPAGTGPCFEAHAGEVARAGTSKSAPAVSRSRCRAFMLAAVKYAPPPEVLARLDEASVEEALRAFYVTRSDSSLRPEEVKKIPQLAGILPVLARTRPDPLLVDAAAGRAPVGLMAARLLGWSKVVVIEREPERADSARRAAARVDGIEVDVREGDVADEEVWPTGAEVVVALHACGSAFDGIADQAIAKNVRWVLAVPCCYANAVAFSNIARAWADRLGVAAQAPVRRRFIESLIDTERTLRLEAAGYRVSVQAFVPPAVTPHNLLWKAQRVGPGRRSAEAKERWERLAKGPP